MTNALSDRTRERRLRYRAQRAGLALHKSRRGTATAPIHLNDLGGYMLIDRDTNGIVHGSRFELDLDDVEEWLARTSDA